MTKTIIAKNNKANRKIVFAIFLSILLSFSASALAKSPQAEIMEKYVKARMMLNFEEELNYIHPLTLNSTKVNIISQLKNARTIPDEKNLLKELGYKSIEEIENDSEKNVYLNVNKMSAKSRVNIDKEQQGKVIKSLNLKIILEGMEDEYLYHIVFRRSFINVNISYNDLQLISLRKHEGKWLVSLVETVPRLKKIDPNAKEEEEISIKDLEENN